ncbi:hypothetical protein L7F22_050888 [Adiantum nelumboides]|nr:hypothetical protein [Adiantum nelumboides]
MDVIVVLWIQRLSGLSRMVALILKEAICFLVLEEELSMQVLLLFVMGMPHGIFVGSFSNDSNDLDHAVLFVGYGFEHGKDYWIVKKSESEALGKESYVHVKHS